MAQSQTTSETSVVLTNPSKWYQWISEIKTSATLIGVWAFIDPSIPTEPTQPTEPDRPTEEELETLLDQKKDSLVSMKMDIYNSKEGQYYYRMHGLSAIMTQIRKSISSDYAIHIQGKENPYQALRALKLQIEPDLYARAYNIDLQYKALCGGPTRNQSLYIWLNKWQSVYTEAKATKHADIESGRVLDHFLQSVGKVDHAWAKSASYNLDEKRTSGSEIPTFDELVARFRRTIQKEYDSRSSEANTSFATLQGQQQPEEPTQPSTQSNRSSSKSRRPVPKCICESTHWYNQCLYLNDSIQPRDWQPDVRISKKVEDALKDPEIKAKVDRCLENSKSYKSRKTSNPAKLQATTQKQKATLAVKAQGSNSEPKSSEQAINSTQAVDNFALSNSWILNSGANVHLCNDIDQFESLYPASSGDVIIAGKTTYPIEAYGKVRVNVTSPAGLVNYITLNSVAYIPGFMTNAVSLSKATEALVYWDTRRNTLYTEKDGKQDHFSKLDLIGGHYVIQYRPPKPRNAAQASCSPGEAPFNSSSASEEATLSFASEEASVTSLFASEEAPSTSLFASEEAPVISSSASEEALANSLFASEEASPFTPEQPSSTSSASSPEQTLSTPFASEEAQLTQTAAAYRKLSRLL